MKRALVSALLVLAACDTAPAPPEPTPLSLETPPEFPEMPIPADNPLTEEGVALGKRLFFDPILSVDSTVACASCHDARAAFSDTDAFSQGVAGLTGRNSMPVMNVGWMTTLFWDGRAESVEDQALQPVENEVEMGETWPHVVTKLQRHPDYPARFEAAFGSPDITAERVAQAIAQFERTLISANSRYDRFKRGEITLTPLEEMGRQLFFNERGDCFHCHGTALFTDNRYHNNGLDAEPADPGLEKVTGRASDRGKFKTPSLRNLTYTAPYMHDGRFATLEEVLDFYDEGMHFTPGLDPLLAGRENIDLTDDEKAALVAFLKTLDDPTFTDPNTF